MSVDMKINRLLLVTDSNGNTSKTEYAGDGYYVYDFAHKHNIHLQLV